MGGERGLAKRLEAELVLREGRLDGLRRHLETRGALEARRAAEAERIASVKAGGAVPDGVGEAVARDAYARGPGVAFHPREVVRTEAGNWRDVRCGWQGQAAVRHADAFDVMAVQSARRKAGPAPFTASQVEAGRLYAALSERCAAAGVKCASVEGRAGGTGGGGMSEAVLADLDRLRAMRAAIGDGWALTPARAVRGVDRRRAISIRAAVDDLCLAERPLAVILMAHGWGRGARAVSALRRAVAGALNRLYGL